MGIFFKLRLRLRQSNRSSPTITTILLAIKNNGRALNVTEISRATRLEPTQVIVSLGIAHDRGLVICHPEKFSRTATAEDRQHFSITIKGRRSLGIGNH